HQVVQCLLARGPAGHHETDVENEAGEDLAEVAPGGLPEADAPSVGIGHAQVQRHLAGVACQLDDSHNAKYNHCATMIARQNSSIDAPIAASLTWRPPDAAAGTITTKTNSMYS